MDKHVAIAYMTIAALTARAKMKSMDKYEFLTLFFKEIQSDIVKLAEIKPELCDQIEFNMPQFLHDHFDKFGDYTE